MDANGGEEKISVLVRLRPLSEKEIARNEVSDWECINDSTILFRNSLQELSASPAAYTFDRVFSGDFSTRVVYDEGVRQIALSVLNGINSSIFAYGQTSSGKTYTMVGITEYAVADIFDYIQRHDERAFVMKFSAMEIYNEAIRDLLSVDNTPLRLLDDLEKGVIVEKLKEEAVRDWSHLKELLSVCEAQRKVGETSMNETSSRSHQILRLTIESSASEFSEKENSATLVASVNFVDLAGSERASQSLSAGKRLKEGCHINRSLLTLGTVIRKLSKGRNGHVNYRDSKLTRILQPALGGNARTAIICTVSPIRRHVEQSRNTLLFGICAKQVNTNAKVNVVMTDKALVKHLQKELARLKTQLRTLGPASSSEYTKLIREKDLKIEKLEEEVRDLTKGRDHAQSQYDELLTTVQYDQDSGHCDGLGNQWQEDRREEDPQENEERMEEKSLGLTANHCLDTDIEIFKKGKRFPIDDDDHTSSSLSNTILGSELYDQPSENSAAASGSKKEDYDIMNFEDETTQSRDVLNDEINEERMWESELADEEVVSTASIEVHHIENGFTFEALDNFTFEALDGFVYEAMEPNIQHVRKTSKNATSIDEDASSVDTSAPGNQLQHVSQCSDDGQGKKEELKDHFVPRKNVKDPIIQPSNWTTEFEEQMRLIIELWEMCNVSLIYRTCFFLVFKGDPLDAIYMEVEIRRLSFLRETFSRGIRDDNITPTEASSLRALCRERQMLVLLMYKRFSYEERIRIYYEWDIKLESKQRKNQVVKRLWTDTNDMDRIKMSADIVANMIKFSDQGRSLKEMFGLSFTRPCPSRRKLGWRNNMSCVTFFTHGEIN